MSDLFSLSPGTLVTCRAAIRGGPRRELFLSWRVVFAVVRGGGSASTTQESSVFPAPVSKPRARMCGIMCGVVSPGPPERSEKFSYMRILVNKTVYRVAAIECPPQKQNATPTGQGTSPPTRYSQALVSEIESNEAHTCPCPCIMPAYSHSHTSPRHAPRALQQTKSSWLLHPVGLCCHSLSQMRTRTLASEAAWRGVSLFGSECISASGDADGAAGEASSGTAASCAVLIASDLKSSDIALRQSLRTGFSEVTITPCMWPPTLCRHSVSASSAKASMALASSPLACSGASVPGRDCA